MCTLSWLINDNGYEVFFKRDEQRTRPQAIAPCYNKKTDSIMPIDPQGKGSWIAVNRSGLTLCLLNNYQAQVSEDKPAYISRGLLITDLTKYKKSQQVLQQLQLIDLSDYMPFNLCVFPETLKSGNESVVTFSWDGTRFSQQQAIQPVISSAVSLYEVQKNRTLLFNRMTEKKINRDIHLEFHSSHQPEKGKYSVCMHRDEACTQSVSHIIVNNKIKFRYLNAPACSNEQWQDITMDSCEERAGLNYF